jgi:hypothetical protein
LAGADDERFANSGLPLIFDVKKANPQIGNHIELNSVDPTATLNAT